MTIATTTNRVDASGNGSATSFSFSPVVIFEASDLQVTVRDSSGNETVIVAGAGSANYSVSVTAYPGTGSITYPASGGTPLPAGSTIVIKRIVPLLQSVSLSNQGAYFPKIQEGEYDYLTAIDQQQQEQIGRTMQLSPTDAPIPLSFPSSILRAGQYLAFDSAGIPIAASAPSGGVPVSSAMQPVVGSASKATALILLGGGQFATIAALRANSIVGSKSAFVAGFYTGRDGGEGTFWCNTADTTTADNGGTIFVDAAGQRWYREFGGKDVSVLWFGVPGAANPTTAFQAALNSRGSGATIKGGVVTYPAGYSFSLNSITIPSGVTLRGPYPAGMGAPGMANFSPPYNTLAWLRLNAGATITMSGGSAISGCLIAPAGMTFQQTTSAAFAGTAITATGDDVVVERSLIMGFAQGFSASGVSRIRIRDCNMDNLAGIFISGSTDVGHFESIQMWPFATISQAGTDTLRRSGIGFRIADSNDDSRFTDCFAYGYAVGFSIEGLCVGQVFTSCSADSTNVNVGIGFNIVGGATETKLIGCQASAQNLGYNLTEGVAANVLTSLADCDAWACGSAGILVDTTAVGDVTIRGGSVSGCANAIVVSSATSRVDIDGVRFEGNTAPTAVATSVSTAFIRVGSTCNYGTAAAGTNVVSANITCQSVASAALVLLPPTDDTFMITGSTGISGLSGGWKGRTVTLIFPGAITVTNLFAGTNPNIRLAGGANFVTAVGSTLTVRHNGVQWFEIGRCA